MESTKMGLLAISLASLAMSTAMAWAGSSIEIAGHWARATIGQVPNSAAYMQISNTGSDDDRLLAAATSVARKVQLHEHVNQNGVMKMRQVDGGIAVPANGAIALEPGGLHIMLMGIEDTLVAGQTIPITLTFERQGDIVIDVAIQDKAP